MPGTVLCVDNDRHLVHILGKALEAEGYRVLPAYDGDVAVRTAADEEPDLVLLDLMLPGRDGFGVLEAIRSQDGASRDTPVVLFTACSPTPDYQRRAASLGAAALLTKPMPLDELLTVVAEHAGKGSAPAAVASLEARLSGSLEALPFPALLHHLHGLRATGVLHLTNDKRRKWIHVEDGYPVAVRSNMVGECLGNFLVRTGRISKKALEESRRRMIAGKLQGEILVAMDALSEDEIPTVLRAQAEEKLFEIFSWAKGSFRFEIGGRLQGGSELCLDESPANLILRGVRDRLPLVRIDETFAVNAGAYVGCCESPFYRLQDIDLGPSHQQLLQSLDGTRTLGSIGGDESLRRAVYALLAAGLLELRSEPCSADGLQPAASVVRERTARPQDESLRAELAELAERVRDQDHFQVFGLGAGASDQALRSAYERLATQIHPDRLVGASPPVKRLAAQIRERVDEAYAVLSDPIRRTGYQIESQRASRATASAQTGSTLDAERQFQEGEAAMRQRRYEEAVACFRKATQAAPDAGEYHAHLGWAVHKADPEDGSRLGEAINHVRKAIKLARSSEKPYLFMGRLLKVADEPDAAEKMFTRAVQLQPGCFEALRELRLLKMRREKSKGLVRRLLRR